MAQTVNATMTFGNYTATGINAVSTISLTLFQTSGTTSTQIGTPQTIPMSVTTSGQTINASFANLTPGSGYYVVAQGYDATGNKVGAQVASSTVTVVAPTVTVLVPTSITIVAA